MQRGMLLNTSECENGDDSTCERSTTPSLYDQGVISLHQLDTFYQYVPLVIAAGVFALFTGILNIAGNTRSGQEPCVSYFIGVSVGDSLCLLSVFCRCLLPLFSPPSSFVYETYYRYVTTFANTVVRRGTIVLNGVASSERFMKLIFPFKSWKNPLSHYPRCVIVGVYVLSFVAHLSLAVEYVVEEVDVSVWVIVSSSLRLQHPDLFNFLRNGCRVVFVYLPLTYSLVINVALIVALRMHAGKQRNIRATRGVRVKEVSLGCSSRNVKKSDANHQTSNGRSIQTEAVVKTSRLVLIFTFAFFLFALPTTLSSTVMTFVMDYGPRTRNHYLYIVLTYLAEWVVYISQPFLFTANLMFNQQFSKSLGQKLNYCRFRDIVFSRGRKSESKISVTTWPVISP